MTPPSSSSFILHPSSLKRSAFTLVELLVSISILALLISITVMGISKFRRAAWAADTQNELMTVANAIQNYYSQFHAYPGPVPNSKLGTTTVVAYMQSSDAKFDTTTSGNDLSNVTGTEDLVLALYGGLKYATDLNGVAYDPALVGQGPRSLNPLSPKAYGAFMEDQNLLSWRNDKNNKKTGHYADDAGDANDTVVPELVDRFPQGMPILYLRASSGYELPSTTTASVTANNVITKGNTSAGQFQLEQILGYTGANTGTWPSMTADTGTLPPAASTRSIGEQKSIIKGDSYTNAGSAIATPAAPYHGLRTVTGAGSSAATLTKGDAKFQYPYDAYAYLRNPSLSSTTTDVPRQKDMYILISAGPDRIYGTEDDITNFGTVGE